MKAFVAVYLLFLSKYIKANCLESNEDEALAFLDEFNVKYSSLLNKYVLADWEYNTNLTDENAAAANDANLAASKYADEAFIKASSFNTTNFSYDTKRQLSKVGMKSLTDDKMKNLTNLISEMGRIYGEAKVCPSEDSEPEECLPLEPDLTLIMATSKNLTERLWAWEGWRNIVGRQLKPLYIQYVQLKNELAKLNGYEDYGDQLRMKYETDTFESDIANLYCELEPLYKELHAYIRRKLFNVYGGSVVSLDGTLPQHILGDMWGRFWTNIYEHAVPYPERPSLDVTEELIKQGYTPKRMFCVGEDFFTSMGLQQLPPTFYDLSMIEKPENVEVLCHATAWDFYDGKDFRIKMCTKVNYEDFLTIHHELGHVQYFMEYAHQPVLYKDGANDGFHEAVGELISMCVSTPKHLHAIGLIDEELEDPESELNYLLSIALNTISSLPFHYVMDLWRWKAFRGEFPLDAWNDEFWKLFKNIVGVHPPVSRGPQDLDPPTIFHVALDYDMIRYFTRTILQFQFSETLCEEAGHVGPLNRCDFYGSQKAGKKLSNMLRLGSSKPWPDALEEMTGLRKMDPKAIRDYFKPLEKYLKLVNAFNNDVPGWKI